MEHTLQTCGKNLSWVSEEPFFRQKIELKRRKIGKSCGNLHRMGTAFIAGGEYS